jgi:hypothetical protein
MTEFALRLAIGTAAFEGELAVEDVIKLADNRMQQARVVKPEAALASR